MLDREDILVLVCVLFERFGRGGMSFVFIGEEVNVFFWMGWEFLF